MKENILIQILVLIASFTSGQTQAELNEDARNKYEMTDKELIQVYNNILKEYNKIAKTMGSIQRCGNDCEISCPPAWILWKCSTNVLAII